MLSNLYFITKSCNFTKGSNIIESTILQSASILKFAKNSKKNKKKNKKKQDSKTNKNKIKLLIQKTKKLFTKEIILKVIKEIIIQVIKYLIGNYIF